MLTKKKKKKMMMMMKLPFLFKSSGLHHNDKSAWPWPSCRQPRTLSFRTTTAAAAAAATESSDSFFTLSSESSGSLSTASECSGGDPIERMIRGLRSTERLLFEPTGKSRSILKEEKKKAAVPPPLKEGTTVVSMDSDDPFWDFRKSMEEMVEAYGLRDWKSLEELLSWYLSVNGKNNHGFILGAFLDLLVSLAMAAAAAAAASSSISSSSSSSFLPCVSSSMEIEEITSLDEHHHHHVFF